MNNDSGQQSGSNPESLNERSKREKRKDKGSTGLIIVLLMVLVGATIVGGLLYKKYAPSKKMMPLTTFFQSSEDEVLLMLHDTVLEETGYIEGKELYLPYEVVVDNINQRFYFDSSENILSLATATELIRSEVGSTTYTINKSKVNLDYPVIKVQGEQVYLAMDFVKEYSNVEFNFYENPNRLMIEAGWGNTYQYYSVKKATQLRYKPGSKSDVLVKLEEADILRVVNDGTEEMESYDKVMTKDGVAGYVLKKYLSEPYEEEMVNDYTGDVFPHITKDKTINMTWHQVTTTAANDGLLNAIASTKGLNVISPTWFSLADNNGNVTSLASETYVQRAHNSGLEVWALCDDFKASKNEISLAEVLGKTSKRDKLINRLLANAIEYNLDGINIDFENIKKETAPAYLEFLRELSIKCRVNGIVLSVDSYVPSEYTEFYDREEQGKVVDYVVVMTYDEHYAGSEESGSVSSIGFVKDAVTQITQMVPPSQVIMALPFYTRLWKEQSTESGIEVSSSAYGMSQAESIVAANGAKVSWDKETAQNYAQYESQGIVYKIWLEDEKSLEEKLKVVFAEQENGKIAGVSSWKLTLEKSSVWDTIIKYTN